MSQAPAVARAWMVVTTSDTVNFSMGTCLGIYVGGAGDVVAVMPDGTTGKFSSVPAGTILPIKAIRVNATNTTATAMTVMF